MCDHIVVGVYSNQRDVEATIQMLQEVNVSMATVSLAGRDGQALEGILERYSEVEQKATSPETWVGDLPGVGPFVLVGPRAELRGALMLTDTVGDIVGRVTFADIAVDYHHWLKVGRFLVIVRCSVTAEPEILKVLDTYQARNPESYQFAGADAGFTRK